MYLFYIHFTLLEDEEDGLCPHYQLFQFLPQTRIFGMHAFCTRFLFVAEGGEDCCDFDGSHVVEVSGEDEVSE